MHILAREGWCFRPTCLPGNYLAKQIAVIYDQDGSVTDLLLGSGASDPSGCRQSAVTESVDSIVAEWIYPARGAGVERPLYGKRSGDAACRCSTR